MFKLPFRLKSQKFPNVFVVADIGTNAVKCLVIEYDGQEQRMEIKGAYKQNLEQGVVRAGNIIDIEKTAAALDEAIFKSTEGLEEQPTHIVFGVSGDLNTSLVTTVRVTRANPDEITQKELNEINARMVDSAYAEAQEIMLKNKGDPDTELNTITTTDIYTKLDGIQKDPLVGQAGQKLEIAKYTAFSPVYHTSHLQELASMMKLEILAIASTLYALTELIKRANSSFDGIIIDVGSSSTQIGVVFGGGLVASKTLNLGGTHFTKKLSQEFNINMGDAERLKHEHVMGNLPDSDMIKVENVLSDIANTWVEGLEIVFGEFEGVKTFAHNIYLTGGASRLPILVDTLETKPWTKAIPFKRPPEFNRMDNRNLEFIKDMTGILEHSEFIVPAALSLVYLELLKSQ